jgi:hypothetical protein
LDDEREVLLRTFAAKKSKGLFGFFNRREVILFSDGTLAYKYKKKPNEIKNEIKTDEIEKLERDKNIITLHVSDQQIKTIILKFDNHSQA